MPLVVVGANHRTAPIELRERLALGRMEIPGALALARESTLASEAVLLSTCNRTELYLTLPEEGRGVEQVRALLAQRVQMSEETLAPYLYVHRDRAVAAHLFRVAAGLDSMVVGEPQIQGQVKEAYHTARQTESATGPVVGAALNRLFQSAFAVGGQVRNDTGIGMGAASISSAAVELAKKIFGSLRGRRAMVLGAGEMSEVTLECLHAEGIQSTLVSNRTFARAREMAARWDGIAIRFDEFEAVLTDVDVVICSTAAPHAVLTRRHIQRAAPGGLSHPLCIIDIAVPRDVDPAVGDESNVFLYNIDDLRQIVGDNLERRRAAIPLAESIIADGVEQFWSWYSSLEVVPTIRDLRDRGEQLRQQEVERLLRRLGHLAPEDQQAIDALTRSLLNKLLHAPTVRLREAAGNGRGTAVLDAVRYLFELDAAAHDAAPEAGAPRGPEPDGHDTSDPPVRPQAPRASP
jgi:glutamyl-tRNA reductase